VNVALYGPKARRWAMTERKRAALSQEPTRLGIGPSALHWDGSALTIEIDEVASPIPSRLRGTLRLEPTAINSRAFTLEEQGRHMWRPIAPHARVSLDLDAPDLRWRGDGYFDTNCGDEPLEDGFSYWTWARTGKKDGAATILYDAERRRDAPLSLALRFDRSGACETFAPPPMTALPRTGWRVARRMRSDDAQASILQNFEDTPFYSRSLVSASLQGETVQAMHESLSLDRFANPLVRLMLPFRMPRW
jgi:carotenoid 1,2-hydratase